LGSQPAAIRRLTERARNDVLRLATDHPGARVVVHSLGLREGHSAETLRDYADTGNFGLGLYYFLQTQHDIRGSVGDCLGTVARIAVCDVQVEVASCHWEPKSSTETPVDIDFSDVKDGYRPPWQCGFYGADSVGSAAGTRDMKVLLPPRVDIAMMAPTEQHSFILCVIPSSSSSTNSAPVAAAPAVAMEEKDDDLVDYEDEKSNASVPPIAPLGGIDDNIKWSFAPSQSQCTRLRDLPSHVTLRVSYKGFTLGVERTVITRRFPLAALTPDPVAAAPTTTATGTHTDTKGETKGSAATSIDASSDGKPEGKQEKRATAATSLTITHPLINENKGGDNGEDDEAAGPPPIVIPREPQLIHVLTHICRIRVATLLQRLGPGASSLQPEMERLHALLIAIMNATIGC
jgi:hypothetical protein